MKFFIQKSDLSKSTINSNVTPRDPDFVKVVELPDSLHDEEVDWLSFSGKKIKIDEALKAKILKQRADKKKVDKAAEISMKKKAAAKQIIKDSLSKIKAVDLSNADKRTSVMLDIIELLK